VPLRAQQPAAHYLNGRTVLSGPHLGTVGRGRGGGMATSGEPVGSGGWGSTRLTLRSRAVASIGCLAGHAELARYLELVVSELLPVGALPPHGRETKLGSPYIKYKGSCLILAASRQTCQDALKLDHDKRPEIERPALHDVLHCPCGRNRYSIELHGSSACVSALHISLQIGSTAAPTRRARLGRHVVGRHGGIARWPSGCWSSIVCTSANCATQTSHGT